MRDARIGGKFHTLGIDHNQAYLFGRGAHDQRGQHRVDEAGLTGTGGTSHQQMRHLGQIGSHEVAFDIFADAGNHRVRIVHGLIGTQHVAQMHDLTILVRDFDADGGFAGNRRKDAHIGAGHRIGDVALQVGDFFHLDAGSKLDLILGDRRASQESDNLGIHLELLKGGSQRPNHAVICRRAHRVGLPPGQQAQVRQLVWLIGIVLSIVPIGSVWLAIGIGDALAHAAAIRIGSRISAGGIIPGCRNGGHIGLRGAGRPWVICRRPAGHNDSMVGSNRTRRSDIGGMRGTLIGRGRDGPPARDFTGRRIYHWSFRSGAMLAGRTVEGIVGGIPIKGLVVLRLGFTSKQPSEETRFGRTGLVLSIRLLIGASMRGHAFGKSERGVSNTNLVGELIAVIRLLALGHIRLALDLGG